MEIKNIILYDPWHQVSGFIEFKKSQPGKTFLKLRHTFPQSELVLSVTADGKSHIFAVKSMHENCEIAAGIDLCSEVFACIMHRVGNKVTTLASGAINLTEDQSSSASEPLGGGAASVLTEERGLSDRTEDVRKPSEFPQRARGATGAAPPQQTGCLHAIVEETENAPIKRAGGEKPLAVREIDEALRAVCCIDDKGKGMCESCPYREYFYEFTLDHKINKDRIQISQ